MKLIPDKLREQFKELESRMETYCPLIIAKFFDPAGSGTWYVTEYYPDTNSYFGYVTGLGPDIPNYDGWAYFSLDEPSIEQDMHFQEIRFDELIKQLEQSHEIGKIKEEQENDEPKR
ncbi:DUF2958 domain-containing protein [Muricauda sp. SCSIO 64092]|uniref:DUF2958 domain-containing protein n=1 Tax=Allomuricauda sp. SCSIO 64092 TaxID=2908842 RepID=UPI001FF11878|nr:DUF2958 domain-containing protein [Muricauda sp. SCSIO 64092]UOY05016.1 DUF2958 domain-containing protein [Muricauda sp. SCSIO 64092]